MNLLADELPKQEKLLFFVRFLFHKQEWLRGWASDKLFKSFPSVGEGKLQEESNFINNFHVSGTKLETQVFTKSLASFQIADFMDILNIIKSKHLKPDVRLAGFNQMLKFLPGIGCFWWLTSIIRSKVFSVGCRPPDSGSYQRTIVL